VSKQLDELLNSEAGVGDDAAQGTGPDLFVIGNDDSRALNGSSPIVPAGTPALRLYHSYPNFGDNVGGAIARVA
jgi:hypothetical protein